MHRFKLWIGLAALVALISTGLAVAHGSAKGTQPVSATFTAAPSPDNKTQTCKGVDGTYNITRGTYTGTATSTTTPPDPRLTGNITIRAKSVVNTTNGYGWTVGQVELRNPASGKLKGKANLSAVNTQNGVLNGFLLGRVHDPGAALVANFSAAFSADGKSLSGELGGEATVAPKNSAILFSGTGCEDKHSDNHKK